MKKFQADKEGTRAIPHGVRATGTLSRRAFVLWGSAALATGTTLSVAPLVLGEELIRDTVFSVFSENQKESLSAVQQHLFPKGADSPGALDINAMSFLQWVITQSDFDADSRSFIINGIQSLGEASQERFDHGFARLDFAQKESLLRYLADNTRWGRNWLSLLLYYIFEALLADPVYGCNPQGIGWQWLEHQAGFPRPPADKIYTRL